jgi:oxygen-independent coproporphyrinogen-3 oxidase
LGARGITRLLKGIGFLLPEKAGEFTVEVNPESADEAFLAACGENGVNRISAGVETFHERSRRAVHRGGGAALLPERLALIARSFPGSFSADLLSGLPFQDEAVLLHDIETTLSFNPAHVSLYSLTLEDGTPLAERARQTPRRGGAGLPSTEEADRLWLSGRDALERAGYAQYEVSNFSPPGKESRHNIRYWRMENWLALGPSASATVIDDDAGAALRYTIRPDVETWLNRGADEPPAAALESLDTLTLMKESFLMGFRYIEGPGEALFRRRFRRGIEEAAPRTICSWRSRGLLRQDKAALTKEGLRFLDRFLVEAFGEMERCFVV